MQGPFGVGEDAGQAAFVEACETLPRGLADAEGRAAHAVRPALRGLSPKVRVVVAFLAERFGPGPYRDRAVS